MTARPMIMRWISSALIDADRGHRAAGGDAHCCNELLTEQDEE
jgi:hypothetical protein